MPRAITKNTYKEVEWNSMVKLRGNTKKCSHSPKLGKKGEIKN
jgi:hypothetical protein